MKIPLVPDIKLDSVYDITPEFLSREGFKLLLLDLDNTLLPYSVEFPDEKLLGWIETMKTAGVTLFIVSNNRGQRPYRIAPRLGIDFVAHSGKPNPRQVFAAMERFGFSKEETTIVGDQIYTDGFTGYRAKVRSIIVKPLKFENPLRVLRYAVELPFRALCKNTGGREK